MILDPRQAFAPVDAQGRYVAALAGLRRRKASGVYGILKGSTWLYVGESHTGRLYDTITRHFREWCTDPQTDRFGRRRGGTEYDRQHVRLVVVESASDEAEALQFAEIDRLNPRDNAHQGRTSAIPADSAEPITIEIVGPDDDEPAPF